MDNPIDINSPTLNRYSSLFWAAALVPVLIILLGINFIFNPTGASTGFGIPIRDAAAFPYMWIKGIRDIFSGLVVLTFLWNGDRRTTGILLGLAIFIPVCDGLVILRHIGFAPPIYMHWGTAVYMAIVTAFLLKKSN